MVLVPWRVSMFPATTLVTMEQWKGEERQEDIGTNMICDIVSENATCREIANNLMRKQHKRLARKFESGNKNRDAVQKPTSTKEGRHRLTHLFR